jgi:hypothetical protein
MHGVISQKDVTLYFGISRYTLEVERVTATTDGALSGAKDDGIPRILHCGDRDDPETEVILQFGLIEVFCVPKREQDSALTRRRVEELTDLSERLKRVAASRPEMTKTEREVDMLGSLPRNEAAIFIDALT